MSVSTSVHPKSIFVKNGSVGASFRRDLALAGVREGYEMPSEGSGVEHVGCVKVLRPAAASDDEEPSIDGGTGVRSHRRWRVSSDLRLGKEERVGVEAPYVVETPRVVASAE